MNVGEICNRDATTICASASLYEAAMLLTNSYSDALVAIASPVPRPTALGVITYREVLDTLAGGADLKSVRVLDVLDKNPIVLHSEDTLEEAIVKLRCRGAKHAHVTGQGGICQGIVSMDRLLGCCRHAAQLGSQSNGHVENHLRGA